MLWLAKIWQVSSCGKFMQHLKLVYFDSWRRQSFVSTCDVLYCLFCWKCICYQESLLFMASLFIGFLVGKYVACQSRKSDFGWRHFCFWPCLMLKRIEKSEAILSLLDSFIPANFFWDISVRFLSWECWDFRRRHDHFRRFPKNSEVFRRNPKSSEDVRSLPKAKFSLAFHFKNQRLRGRYCHLFILHMVFAPYMGLS